MTAQSTDRSHHPNLLERMTAGARRLAVRVDSFAFRAELGPTRDEERRHFRPSRRP